MAEPDEPQRVDRPVRISDNGVRSFLPPTFCFELRDGTDTLVATVSQVLLPERSVADFELLELFAAEKLTATGVITGYDAGAQARVAGRRFTVERVHDATGADGDAGPGEDSPG